MFCKNCGAQLKDGASFCTHCGAQIASGGQSGTGAVQRPVQPAAPRENPSREQSDGKKTPLLILAVILAVLIVVVAGAIAAVLVFRGRASEENAAVREIDSDDGEEEEFDEEAFEEEASAEDNFEEQVIDEADLPQEDQMIDMSEEPEEVRRFILPNSDSAYLSLSDLTGLTKEECRIARNELYARHGRLFDDEKLQNYFNGKDWYAGYIEPADFSDSVLNDYEIANRDLIVKYEEEMGYR